MPNQNIVFIDQAVIDYQSLIASLDVATGQIIEPTCSDTKTEVDFALHVLYLLLKAARIP